MLDWIKRLFGFAEEVVTLASKHADATRAGEMALSAFTYAADKLEDAATALREVSAEAFDLAEKYGQQAHSAITEAEKNILRAAKIRELLG